MIRRRAPSRAGATLVILAFSIVLFVLFAALTVDVGYWYYQKAKLQGIVDVATVSALGTMSDRQTIDAQKLYIKQQLDLMAQGNGYEPGQFIPTFTTTVSNAFGGPSQEIVESITVNTSQTVETFFWKIMRIQSIQIDAEAEAERVNFAPSGGGQLDDGSCISFLALGNIVVDHNLNIDSYDSRSGGYNPSNAAPSGGGRRYHRGNAIVHANGNLTKSTTGDVVNYYGYLRIDGSMDMRDSYLSRLGRTTGVVGERDGALTTDGGTTIVGTIDATTTVNDIIGTLPKEPSDSTSDYDNANITNDGTLTFTGGIANVRNNGVLNVTGGSGNIFIPAGGRYRFTTFTTTATARVRVTGSTTAARPTQIWWDATGGTMTVAGGVTLDSGTAKHIVLLNTGTRAIDLTARVYGTSPATNETYVQIYSPGAAVTLRTAASTSGNPAWFIGSVVGSTVTFIVNAANDRFVYDEALGCAEGLQSNAPSGVAVDVHLIR